MILAAKRIVLFSMVLPCSFAILAGCQRDSSEEILVADVSTAQSGSEQGDNSPRVAGAALLGSSSKPASSPKAKAPGGVEIRESTAEANAYFPPRRVVAEYVDGQLHGDCRGYDDRGRLIFVEPYVRGTLHGTRVCYYPSGKKFNESRFVNGVAQGMGTTWFENGKVANTSMVKDGIPHGEQISYFDNGNRMVASTYVNGVNHGDMLFYLPDGRMYAGSGINNGVEYDRHLYIDPTQADVAAMNERNEFSGLLKDHWPPVVAETVATSKPTRPRTPSAGTIDQGSIRQGDHVEVEWKGSWYPAEVLQSLDGQFRIRYQGYSSDWDETVGPERIRTVTTKPQRLGK